MFHLKKVPMLLIVFYMVLQTNRAHSEAYPPVNMSSVQVNTTNAALSETPDKDEDEDEDEWDPNSITQGELDTIFDKYENFSERPNFLYHTNNSSCSHFTCDLFANVVKAEQRLYLYNKGGDLMYTWDVSTGVPGKETIYFDGHPDGRIYTTYSSKKYPSGSFRGLGNMPYAVFLTGGYAIHGTPEKNWSKLGTKASHGCVRLHPNNAKIFNDLVRFYKVANVWVSITDQKVQEGASQIKLGMLE